MSFSMGWGSPSVAKSRMVHRWWTNRESDEMKEKEEIKRENVWDWEMDVHDRKEASSGLSFLCIYVNKYNECGRNRILFNI